MQPSSRKSVILKLLLLVGLVIVALIGYKIYLNSHFRITGTSPSTKDISIDSPYLKINFNRQLVSKGLSVSSSPIIISSYTTSDKTLTINLKYPLDSSVTYSIDLKQVTDTKGESLYNKVFNFKPKYVPYSSLSSDQQKTMLQNQTKKTPSPATISYSGLDSFSARGVTTAQINDFQQAIFRYSPNSSSAVIDTGSVAPVPHDPNSASMSDSINFNLKIDATAYKATIIYSRLTTLRLVLYDTAGNQVYDSGDITSS